MPTPEAIAVIRPLIDPTELIDVRAILAREIERELAARCGGNPVLNRLEAEAWADSIAARGIDGGAGARSRTRTSDARKHDTEFR